LAYEAESMLPDAEFSRIKLDVMRFLIGVVLLLQSLSVFAQNEHYNFSKLDTHTGLSNNQVNAILKDQDGFLWFGTMSGLNRYDGYSYRVFRKNYNDSSSLLDNSILSLYELPGGKMWVSTMGESVFIIRLQKNSIQIIMAICNLSVCLPVRSAIS
jgi:ligand-binding sensor domain-containing protein